MASKRTGRAIIVIPSQGENTSHFLWIAKRLRKEVYGGRATIVKTTVTKSGEDLTVTFAKTDGTAFAWATTHDISRVLLLTHGGMCDGPNLAYRGGGYQPWGASSRGCNELSENAKRFWLTVGTSMRADGRILLLACTLGYSYYAGAVAGLTGRQVFAATSGFSAADESTVLRHVRAIERSKALDPMKQFGN